MSARSPRAEPPHRKGWCPGALTPMESGDGLLARVRASGGKLDLAQAHAIAEAALECGNGAISLSSRANLQIRGVSDATLPELMGRLDAAGVLDREADIERLRNIVASPLSDIDPAAAFDLAPSVARLEARLAEHERLRPLPAKFGFVLDALGRLPVTDVEADVRFEAAREDGVDAFAVFLGGDDSLAARCARDEIGDSAASLALAFLALADAGKRGERRMRALVEHVGAAALFARAKLKAAPCRRAEGRASLRDVLGAHVFGGAIVVGAAAPFGIIEASSFGVLIERAREAGALSLRLTPWRAFLISGLAAREAASIVAASAKLGFIMHADDPRLSVAVCPGAPACLHAHRPLREDAARWANLLPQASRVILHVSGCGKGCARPAATSMTLTATASGYDLVLNGKAGDPPARGGLSSRAVDLFIAAEAPFVAGRTSG
ncbi:MAG: precorrin-3B synthase [Hyphomicrobiales bacterium]|nr:precorrin-3B synthase [Hyphomicrobiales bacterium]